jgi:hypothetical protein
MSFPSGWQRPTTAFGSNFVQNARAESIRKTEEHNQRIYDDFKQKIQRVVLQTQSESCSVDVTGLHMADPQVIERLKKSFSKRGFKVTYHPPARYQSGLAEYSSTQPCFDLELSDSSVEEEGYSSDGWKPECSGAKIKAKIQEVLDQQYEQAARKIEKVMKEHPRYQQFQFEISNRYYSSVLKTLIEELQKKGFGAVHSNGSVPDSMSSSLSYPYNYLLCTNPVGDIVDKPIRSSI